MKGKLHVVETCGHRKWILCWGSKKEMMPYLESPISSVNTSNSTAVPQWRNLSTSLQQSHDNHTMITWQSSQTHHPTTIKQSCNDHTWQSHHCHMTHQVDHSLFHVKYNVHGSWRELVEKNDNHTTVTWLTRSTILCFMLNIMYMGAGESWWKRRTLSLGV